MKLRPFLFLVVLIPTLLFAQPNPSKVDSLRIALAETNNDSVKFWILFDLSYHLSYRNYEKSLQYANQAEELAYQKDWNWAKERALKNQSNLAELRGDYYRSLEYAAKSLQISLELQDTTKLITSYINMGNGYLQLGQLEEAFFYNSKAHELSAKINDESGDAISLHNLAVVYSNLGRLDLALAGFEESARISKKINDIEAPAYNTLETGKAYLRVKNFEKARKYFQQSIAESKKFDIINMEPKGYQALAELMLETRKYDQCLVYYDSAITSFKRADNKLGQQEAQLGISRVHLAKKDYAQAEQLATTCLNAAHQLRAQLLEFECLKTLATCAEHQGNFKRSLEYLKQSNFTRDSINSVNVISQVFESELQMLSQKKDEEIESLKKIRFESAQELKRQEFLRNIFAVVFALTIILLYTVYRSGRRKLEMNNLLIQHQAEIEKRTQELEELNKVKDKFFSIISHDLRSPINSLAGLLDLMEKNEIKAEELPALTKEMRVQFNHTRNLINNLLDWTLLQMNKVSIRKEKVVLKTLVDDNIKLLSSMSTKKINFANQISDTTVAFADQNMINLIFRNLLLNGIKFTPAGGNISISAEQAANMVTIAVTDNGVGIAPEIQKVLFDKTTGYSTRGTANEKGTGLGLILCKEFIERNGGQIWLQSEVGKGSTFFVTIPVV